MSDEKPSLITCVVQRGEADKVVDAALEAGAEGATIYFGRGRGVRERMGFLGRFVKPEKEVILIITRQDQTAAVFEAVQDAARLKEPGTGFAFLHKIDRAIGFMP